MVELIEDAASRFHPAIVIIDALDGFTPSNRHELLLALNGIVQKSSNVIKISVSSRNDGDIVAHLQDPPSISVNDRRSSLDIEKFVCHTVERAFVAKTLLRGQPSSQIKQELDRTLIKKSHGI